MVRGAHEHVGRLQVGLELGLRHRPGEVDRLVEAELGDEGTQRRLIGLPQRRADQVQARRGVVESPQDGQHLDQIVRGLVRRHLAHEDEIGPSRGRLAFPQPRRHRRVGLLALAMHVDQQRHHRRVLVAQGAQLRFVEGGVGHGEMALRCQPRQLGAAERDLVGHVRLPVAQQVGRRDVVVVHQLGLGARGEDVVDRAADGGLVEQPPIPSGAPELGHRASLVGHVGGHAAVEDVRVDTDLAQPVAQVHGVDTDGITAGQGRDDLIDAHGRAVYRCPLSPRFPRPGRRPGRVPPL